jgi:hypothetical protein
VQCILPALDGLLPEDLNSVILDLVFVMGCWHAYAKLRLHTEATLESFDQVTADLGILLRQVALRCNDYRTTELPRELNARIRRLTKKGQSGSSGGSKAKKLSLSTIKLHAIGDYPKTIRERGATDNYTSQWVWVGHRSLYIAFVYLVHHRSSLHIGLRRDTIQTPINMTPKEILLDEHAVLRS